MNTYREYRVISFRSPTHTIHSGAILTEAEAQVRFADAKRVAQEDTGIKRVALYGYTNSATVLLDHSLRLGGLACKLKHESPRLHMTRSAKAA